MRNRNPEFKIYIFIWIVVLLLSALEFYQGFRDFGFNYFLTLDFYANLLLLGCMILLFIGILKNDNRLIIIAFGGIVTIEAVKFFPVLLYGISTLIYTRIGDTLTAVTLLVEAIFRPFSLVAYALTYIACMILYFFNKRQRHALIQVVSALGVIVLLAEVATVVVNFFYVEPRPELIDIFFDLVFAVFFHLIYIFLPRLMHNHNLY